MLRKLLIFCMLMPLTLTSVAAFAAVPAEVDQTIKANMPSVIEEAKKQPEFWKLKDSSEIPTIAGQPYQVFQLDLVKAKTLSQDYKVGSFASALRPDPYWEYPLLDKTGKVVLSAGIAKQNDKWAVVDIGQYLPRDLIQFSSDNNAIMRQFQTQGITGIDSLMHVRVAALHVDLIYATTEQADYLMPLSAGADKLGLENKKAYPAQDIISSMAQQVSEPNVGPDMVFGGASTTSDAKSVNRVIPIVGMVTAIFALLGLVGWLFIRRRTNAKAI